MSKPYPGVFLLLLSALLLSACSEKQPQDVAAIFWNAAISNDAKAVVKYSNVGGTEQYHGFEQDLSGLAPSFGKIVIEGDHASVTTTLASAEGSSDKALTFETLLIRQDGKWKVDYAKTRKELSGGPFAQLFGQIARIGKTVSKQLNATSDELRTESQRIAQQLDELAKTYGDQASGAIAQYGEELRQNIDELAKSVVQALAEQHRELTDSDRQTLQQVADDLNNDSEQLAEPTFRSIAAASQSVAASQQKLNGIDNEAITAYQEQWQSWGDKIREELNGLIAEIETGQSDPNSEKIKL